MKNNETFVYRSLFLLAAIIGLIAGWQYYSGIKLERKAIENQKLSVAASEVIGDARDFRGRLNSPYTLVEYGDYECPPCRAANQPLSEALDKHRDKLKFKFRNFPLKAIHPYAMPMAVFAEAARYQGKYWDAHDALYRQDLNERTIGLVTQTLALDRKKIERDSAKAMEAVNNDAENANRLHISYTPTFLLCCPSGKVLQLNDLSQIDTALNIP